MRVCAQVQEVHAAVKGDYESSERQLRAAETFRAQGMPGVHHSDCHAVKLFCASCRGKASVEVWSYFVQYMSACGFAHAQRLGLHGCACSAPAANILVLIPNQLGIAHIRDLRVCAHLPEGEALHTSGSNSVKRGSVIGLPFHPKLLLCPSPVELVRLRGSRAQKLFRGQRSIQGAVQQSGAAGEHCTRAANEVRCPCVRMEAGQTLQPGF